MDPKNSQYIDHHSTLQPYSSPYITNYSTLHFRFHSFIPSYIPQVNLYIPPVSMSFPFDSPLSR